MTRHREKLSTRRLIFQRDSYTCYLCNKHFKETELEVDHLYPYSKGGRHTLDNLFTACKPCNRKKRDKLDISLITEYMLEDPEEDCLWTNRALNNFPPEYVAAVMKLWLMGKIKIKVGRPI